MVQRPPSDEMRIGGQPLDCEGDGLDPSVRRSSPCERANRTQLAMSAFVLKAKRCGGKIRKKNLKKIPSYLKFATSAVAASTSSAFPLIWSEPSTNQLFGNSFWIKLRGHSDSASAFWQEYRLRQGHYEAPNQPDRLQQSSFITVSALSPTLAIASSISALDEPKCLHHCRTKSLVERSTRCLSGFEEVEINAIVYLVLLAACPKSSA